MRIESLRIKNFKTFRDVHLTDIPPMLVVVGANGTGKSTLFDVFSFLRDCLTYDVRKALNMRGGFREVMSREAEEEVIQLEMTCLIKIGKKQQPVTYFIQIIDGKRGPYAEHEVIRYGKDRRGFPLYFLNFEGGVGYAIADEEMPKHRADAETDWYQIDSTGLALEGLGQFKKYKTINVFRELITSFHLFNFDLNTAIGRKERSGDPEQLSESGDNLALVARTLYEQHPEVFAKVLARLVRHVPGLAGVEPLVMEDGSLILRFQDGSFKAPFLDRQMSDGTVKLFAYLVLLYDPRPRGLLAVDEPENHLYPKLMAELAEEFRYYAIRSGGQVLIATHSPDFLGTLDVEEVAWLVKRDGRTEIRRAKDNEQVAAYMADGDHLGALWREGLFTDSDPRRGSWCSYLRSLPRRHCWKNCWPGCRSTRT